jgi:hypothetical protein
VIKPGQKIHASVAFKKDYIPKAKFANDVKQDWSSILRKGEREGIGWAKEIEEILELDLFDHSNILTIINEIEQDLTNPLVGRLEFLASTRTFFFDTDYERQPLLTSSNSQR